MAFDYKKEYREFYLPPEKPQIIDIPPMNFIAVRGKGDPNEEGGEYKQAIEILYKLAYTVKMSKKGDRRIEGYFDYVVPPLEGFWWQEGMKGADYSKKSEFSWISLIRLPEFVTPNDFEWAISEARSKDDRDFSKAEFLSYTEGLCVQCMHRGPYDDEPRTVSLMKSYMESMGYISDFESGRHHHEIYLSDVRRCRPENLKTVIRHPIKIR